MTIFRHTWVPQKLYFTVSVAFRAYYLGIVVFRQGTCNLTVFYVPKDAPERPCPHQKPMLTRTVFDLLLDRSRDLGKSAFLSGAPTYCRDLCTSRLCRSRMLSICFSVRCSGTSLAIPLQVGNSFKRCDRPIAACARLRRNYSQRRRMAGCAYAICGALAVVLLKLLPYVKRAVIK